MKRVILGGYAGQVKGFLVLLVLFLAAAIYVNFHLLVVARNGIQEEAGLRLGAEADLVRVELERDQMLRGLTAAQAAAPYIPPTFLDRLARLHGMIRIDILDAAATVITSSDAERVGAADDYLRGDGERERRRVLAGDTSISPLLRRPGSRYATLAAYRPVRDRTRQTVAFIRVEREVPVLASVDFDLRFIAAVQSAALVFVLVLVILFARWLLQPYRRLQRAAGEASLKLQSRAAAEPEDAEALVGAFQGVLDKLRDQESELLVFKERAAFAPGAPAPEGRLIAGMSSAALVFDAAGRLTNLNPAAVRLLGVERRGAIGRSYADLLRGNERLLDLIRAGLSSGEGRSREVAPLRSENGRVSHLGVMISPLRNEGAEATPGGADGVVCLLTDLTEIRALQKRGRLKESLASLGEMSAGIAHEFRNSLAAIQGFARLAGRAAADEAAVRDHTDAILREVSGVQRVVTDFLRYARPQTPDLQELDLAALVNDLASEFGSDPAHAGIELRIEGAFPRIVADEALLRQALHNLLRNAAEALGGDGDAGGGAPPRIVLRGSVEPGERGAIRLAVEDNGRGIEPADLPHIFTPFFTTREGGTGLGLALVQKAAIVHDGQVEAASLPGRGTQVAIVLPQRPVAPAADLVA